MELLIIGLALLGAAVVWVAAWSMGFLVGLGYGRWFWDRASDDGSRAWTWVRGWPLWRVTLHRYFGLSIILDADNARTLNALSKERGLLYAHGPHGQWPVCVPLVWGLHGDRMLFGAGIEDPGLLASTFILHWIPGIRDIVLWVGGINPTRDNIVRVIEGIPSSTPVPGSKIGGAATPARKRSLHLIPGGVQESLDQTPDCLDLYLGHQGFLRIAWERGFPVVPVFDRGENHYYRTSKMFSRLRRFTTHHIGYGIPTFFLGPLPCQRGTSIVGAHVDPLVYRGVVAEPNIVIDAVEQADERAAAAVVADKLGFEQFRRAYFAELFRLIERHNKDPPAPRLAKAMEEFNGGKGKLPSDHRQIVVG